MVIYRELSKSGDKRGKLVTDWSWIGHGIICQLLLSLNRTYLRRSMIIATVIISNNAIIQNFVIVVWWP